MATSVPAATAEWNCTRCGTTNRKLVPATTTETRDRCTHCRRWHVVSVGATPVRWNARLEE